MATTDELRPRLEKMLKEFLGVDKLVTDDEGDYPIRSGSAKYYVRLSEGTPSIVNVYAQILVGVYSSPALYDRINRVNAVIQFGRLFHDGETVFAATELVADTMDPEELSEACRSIADMADTYDDLFKREFGGQRQFEDETVGEPVNEAATASS